jgi:hypothetical protein
MHTHTHTYIKTHTQIHTHTHTHTQTYVPKTQVVCFHEGGAYADEMLVPELTTWKVCFLHIVRRYKRLMLSSYMSDTKLSTAWV